MDPIQARVDVPGQWTLDPGDGCPWRVVGRWNGTGIRDTESFHVASDEWRIRWTTSPSKKPYSTSIFVFDQPNCPVAILSGTSGGEERVKRMNRSGDFYLHICSTGPYEVVVEARD